MDTDSATVKFEQALPFAFLPISTQLAALHSSRTHLSLPQSSCSKCGSYFTACKTRVSRSKRNSRTLLTTCSACGANTSVPIDTGNVNKFPSYRKASRLRVLKDQVTSPSPDQSQAPTLPPSYPMKPLPSSKPITTLPLPSNSKSKKKSSLQEMLKKNREKEQQRIKSEPGGLSAFLSTL